MPTIQADGPHVVIVQFETEPDQIEALIEGIAAVVERSFRPDRRFVSASFHARADGRRMLNYAQWTSAADYDAFMREIADGADREIGEAIARAGAKPLGPQPYVVRRVVAREA